MSKKILVINPGSTSTKISLYHDSREIYYQEITHPKKELDAFKTVYDQESFRETAILTALSTENHDIHNLSAVVGRGGMLGPMKAGTYRVNNEMIATVQKVQFGQHASNLGCVLALKIANSLGIPSYVVDPVSVDEFQQESYMTGIKGLFHRSLDHPLNCRATMRHYCEENGKEFENTSCIVVHLGGGISVSCIKKGRIIDVNNAMESGPFSANRAGTLPAIDVVNMCYSGEYDKKEVYKKLVKEAGLISYLGTNDLRDVLALRAKNDPKAHLIFDALVYQIAKEIGAMAAAMAIRPDAILITGGMAHSVDMIQNLRDYVSFIAPVHVYPGSDEMKALAEGVLRVLQNEEHELSYPPIQS
ncbi:MAG: butyrate kinase [Caldisericia bacterium]|nr:butyrate kinase [Caldisericia bacterium]MDD4614316.1 butyrate kinase [Caldisericia bacterium]